jgi:beta-phosphoglucomutase-like phosphatase (HAD superfamily)
MSQPVDKSTDDGALVRIARRLGRVARRSVGLLAAPAKLLLPRRRTRANAVTSQPTGGGVPELASLASDRGLQSLAKALADPDPAARALALELVCEFSGPRAARLLGSMLQDPEPAVRCAAAAAAARVRTPAVVFSLILALEDADPEVRAAAAAGFQSITLRHIDPVALEEPAARTAIVDDLKAWWKDHRFTELATLTDESPSG